MAADTDDPIRVEAGWVERPTQEVDGVIKAELTVRVLDVVISEQRVNFIGLSLI